MSLNEIIQELRGIQSEMDGLVKRQTLLLQQLELLNQEPKEETAPQTDDSNPVSEKIIKPFPDTTLETIIVNETPKADPVIEQVKEIEVLPEQPAEIPPKAAAAAPGQPAKPNLNERLAASKATTPVEAFAGVKIEDLSKAFTLNQKLAFIKHLFGNDAELYNSVISKVNAAGDIDEAQTILGEHIGDANQDILSEFMNYIHRRFI